MQGDSPDELDPGKLLWHPLFDLRGPQLNCFHDRGKDAHQNSEIERQTNVTATLNLKINKFIWHQSLPDLRGRPKKLFLLLKLTRIRTGLVQFSFFFAFLCFLLIYK